MKNITVSRSKKMSACVSGYIAILRSETKQDILDVAKQNFEWVVKNGIIKSSEWKQFFSEEELIQNRIFCEGTHLISGCERGYFTGEAIAILKNGAEGLMTDKSLAHIYDVSVARLYDNSTGITYSDVALCTTKDNARVLNYWEYRNKTQEVK